MGNFFSPMDKRSLSGISLEQSKKFWGAQNNTDDYSNFPTTEKELNSPSMGFFPQISSRLALDKELLAFFEWVLEGNQRTFENNLNSLID